MDFTPAPLRLAWRDDQTSVEAPGAAVEALARSRVRLRAEYRDVQPVVDLYAWWLGRVTQVGAGQVAPAQATNVLKAAFRFFDEFCEPIVKEAKITGNFAAAVAEAARAVESAILDGGEGQGGTSDDT
jgi:hypothetical protein